MRPFQAGCLPVTAHKDNSVANWFFKKMFWNIISAILLKSILFVFFTACKLREHEIQRPDSCTSHKKPRLVFTDIQRRTLLAIFKETRRPNKEMQATIADQLGLKVSTVANFFMNARRRSLDKYMDDSASRDSLTNNGGGSLGLHDVSDS